jgi:hypothetical protein
MATTPEQPPVQSPVEHFDEHTGIYGFFRRHQKKLLYTAGLFTLLTFSITGPMTATFESMFATSRRIGTIEVGGATHDVTPEDMQFATRIAQNPGAIPSGLDALISLVWQRSIDEGGESGLAERLAILRRAAIAEGIDVSMAEVDRAIEHWRDQSKIETTAQMARQKGLSSVAELRVLAREAMRLWTFLELHSLALDTSDACVLESAIDEREKVTFRVATFDEKALEEQLKTAGGLTDEDLRKWLDAKTESDKHRMQAFDTNRVELRFGAALLADFDAAEWQADALKDHQLGEEQLKKTYEQEKEARFKLEGDKNYKPFEDEAVKAELTKLLQAEQVMNHLLGKLRDKLNESLTAPNELLRKNSDEFFAAQAAVAAAKQKVAEKPDDAAAKEELRLAEEVLPAKENAKKEAEEGAKAARAAFDFPAVFAELTKDKKGFVQKAFTGKRNGEELKDLDAGELGLGQWNFAVQATYLQNKGDLSNMPGRTTKAALLYQVTDIEVRPLKAWDKLKPLAEGAYFTEQAKTKAETQKKLLDEALLRLAKAKMPEKVTEIEGKRVADVDAKLAEWEKQTQASIGEAEKQLAALATAQGTQAHAAWQKRLDTAKADLADKEKKRAAFDEEVGKRIEADIAAEAKKLHGEVLDAAAAEAGFTVATVGPLPRDLAQRPRFKNRYDPTTVFLFANHSTLKAGEATGVVEDKTSRRWIAAACTAVEPLTAADVERREYQMRRQFFARQIAMAAPGQSYSMKALEARYRFKPDTGTQVVDEPKAPTPPPATGN